MFQSVLGVVCVGECLEPFMGCFRTVTEASKNATLFSTCARAEDGTFCLVKMLEIRNIGSIVLNCSTFASSTFANCSSTCQQSFRNLKTRMGCCATNYFETPSSLFKNFFYDKYFANCGVPVGTPCNSASGTDEPDGTGGAAIVYLNVVLVIAAFLMTIAIA